MEELDSISVSLASVRQFFSLAASVVMLGSRRLLVLTRRGAQHFLASEQCSFTTATCVHMKEIYPPKLEIGLMLVVQSNMLFERSECLLWREKRIRKSRSKKPQSFPEKNNKNSWLVVDQIKQESALKCPS